MPAKTADRINAMRERAAALAPQPNAAQPTRTPSAGRRNVAVADVSAHFGAALDPLVRNRTVQHIPVGHIAPDLRPEMRQPRLLPPTEDINRQWPTRAGLSRTCRRVAHAWPVAQTATDSADRGLSGESAAYPAARYLILVGQRRWTAANLVQHGTLDADVVDPPTLADRVRIQYAENEDREEFSDMERAWALQQMKHGDE